MVTLLDLLSLVLDCCWLDEDDDGVGVVDCEDVDDTGADEASVGVAEDREDSGQDTITIGETVT